MKTTQTASVIADTVESGQKAGFDFYNGFLTVVYGLLITNGLGYVVQFTSKHPTYPWESVDAFLFLGTFLTALHFWFVCATVDDLSTAFYEALAGNPPSFQGFFVLIDVIVATALAGLLLAMFRSAEEASGAQFYFWFLMAAALSVAYDFYSRLLIFAARKLKRDQLKIGKYAKRINQWIRTDLVFLGAASLMYFFIAKNVFASSIGFSSIFTTFTAALLLMDVCSFEQNGRNPFAPISPRIRQNVS